ncbi:MAG TPA: hypothetical protein VFS20_06520 [Longimicrobium sp.]|nr:hypothetical protein [Longimicrobium sp.]
MNPLSAGPHIPAQLGDEIPRNRAMLLARRCHGVDLPVDQLAPHAIVRHPEQFVRGDVSRFGYGLRHGLPPCNTIAAQVQAAALQGLTDVDEQFLERIALRSTTGNSGYFGPVPALLRSMNNYAQLHRFALFLDQKNTGSW